MALFPCAVGLHRYAGPQRSAYLGIASGAISARSKLRCCSKHFQDLKNYLEENLTLVAIGGTTVAEDGVDTGTCDVHPDQVSEYRGYANIYPLKDEERVYFGAMCQDCADAFRRIGQIELS